MTASEIIPNILLYIIIVGGFLVGILNLRDAIKKTKECRCFNDVVWATWLYSLLGFYWCVVYSILQFSQIIDKFHFTTMYIRPSITLLIILLLLGKQKAVYLPDVIRDFFRKIKAKREGKLYG